MMMREYEYEYQCRMVWDRHATRVLQDLVCARCLRHEALDFLEW